MDAMVEDHHPSSPPPRRHRHPLKQFQPRRYQVEVFEAALRGNTIAVLDTGSGKTMVAVMLARELARRLRAGEAPRGLMVFLAPTVHLVHQQFEVICEYTDLDAAEYHGASGVGEWSAEHWRKEVGSKEIVFMTPQILLDALRHAFVTINMVNLLIFDECHRACGNHPYTRIMQDFYLGSQWRPTIFGMTASPVATKGASTIQDCEEHIAQLELILDAKVYIIEDRAELESFSPSATIVNKYYNAYMVDLEDLKSKLQTLFEKFDALLVSLQESSPNKFQHTNDILETSRKTLSRYHGKILYCLSDLGPIIAAEAVKVCSESINTLDDSDDCQFSKASLNLHVSYFKEALGLIEEILPQGYDELMKSESGSAELTRMGYASPKLDMLINIFKSFGSSKEVLCLIFVERIITAKVVERFMRGIINFSHFSISYLTGGSTSKDALTPAVQRFTLDLFRAGKVNLLFTTDVTEEGIHVPNCSCVIRFDLPKTVCSYVQSRGRARRRSSNYILMIERGNLEQQEHIFRLIQSEYYVRFFGPCRRPNASSYNLPLQSEYVYRVESTGATITADCCVNLIHKYCEKLPKDRYYMPKPSFEVAEKDGSYQCSLTLPPNAAFQRIVGPLSSTCNLAKQLVSLEACMKLHQLGVLNDHLIPFTEEPMGVALTKTDEKCNTGPGTTRRKELHGTINVLALSGTWIYENGNTTLNAYRFDFVCDQEGENYAGFVLLVESVLDDDVAPSEMDLFLIPNKMVYTTITPCGKIQLNKEQLGKGKLFQEFFFNGIFGRLFRGSQTCELQREFIFRKGHEIQWSSESMYLLLPLKHSSHIRIDIHWEAIESCTCAVEHMRNVYLLDGKFVPENIIPNKRSRGENIVHLANKSLNFSSIIDSVVLSLHTGRIYSVLDMIIDTTAESSFDEMYNGKSSSFASFADYYHQKYGIIIQHPEQPLLLLKQSHNAHNLLFSKLKYLDGSNGNPLLLEKEQIHARVPPELLIHINLTTDVLKSFYLLPSIMHRLQSLMLASQLRREIGYTSQCIPCSLILEAITTVRCCETFSLERLELLGDSVLKYVIGCDLFLRYPMKHEGHLSDLRSIAACNATLHKHGIQRSLQGYVRNSAFDPRRWVAPGQISVRSPFPCDCGVDTPFVPIDGRYVKDDTSIVVGKRCDKGHRWMCSKTIADCVEALVGAYYIGGGITAALWVMRWFGIDIRCDMNLVQEVKFNASHLCYFSKINDIEELETKLKYNFSIKGLLLESITHPSLQELGVDYCYQRLEFLGDSVLDLLITRHLFVTHTDVDPGELTDLRSALVSNENFAQAVVRSNIHNHLQHGSGILLEKVTEYVRAYLDNQGKDNVPLQFSAHKAPKVLGDIMESIAGAIFIDADFNVDLVWEIVEPLLSPMITPDKLSLPPYRELLELCSHLGYFINSKCTSKGEEVTIEMSVQLRDDLLIAQGRDRNKKGAKAKAALRILADLKKRGLSIKQCLSKAKQLDDISGELQYHLTSLEEPLDYSHVKDISGLEGLSSLKEAVVLPLKMDKGGPRNALFKLCKILQWPMPDFEFMEQRSRTPIVLDGVTTPNFNSFVSTITLHIPDITAVTLQGEQRTDKKSSQDSAALVMLHKLEELKVCICKT